jgi:hypothetical protein
MDNQNVFISVGGTANDQQEAFVRSVEERLKSENLVPNTVGRNKFTSDSPLKGIMECMSDCSGTIIIGLERTYLVNGMEKRGGEKEQGLQNVKYPTPWNQIEAAIAYSKGQPLLLVLEEGLKSEGLLEKGYDWYVMWVKPESASLATAEFNGVFADWKKKVEAYSKNRNQAAVKKPDVSELTIYELIKALKPSNLWAILVALAAIISGAFALGAKFLTGQ